MSTARVRQARRRRVAELVAEGWSDRRIARELEVSHKTIGRDRATLERVRATASPPAPPEPGNQRATTHGAHAEVVLAPLRTRFLSEVVQVRWPWLDAIRSDLAADLMARIEAARKWVDLNGIVRDHNGNVPDVVDRLDKWSGRLDKLITELEREAKERGASPGDDLAAHLARITAQANDEEGATRATD